MISLIIFIVSLVLHEIGHCLAAYVFGVKINKLTLFFDPFFSLFKTRCKNGLQFSIGWLPFGAYVLFEDDEGHETYFKSIRKDLIDTLTQVGCADAIIIQHGKLGINKDNVYCSYFDLLDGKVKLKDKYQKVYGPLTIEYPCNKWRWLEEPWPWERGNN